MKSIADITQIFPFLGLFIIEIAVLSGTYAQQEKNLFKDGEQCPEMVIIPSSNVYIGSFEEEIGRKKVERNRILTTITQPFAIAKTEVTLAEHRVFLNKTNYKSKEAFYKGEPLVGCNYFIGKSYGYVAEHIWQNLGFPQRETDSLVCVGWSDADAYAQWLTPKGVSWISSISWSRAAVRSRGGTDYKSCMLGFRVAAEIETN